MSSIDNRLRKLAQAYKNLKRHEERVGMGSRRILDRWYGKLPYTLIEAMMRRADNKTGNLEMRLDRKEKKLRNAANKTKLSLLTAKHTLHNVGKPRGVVSEHNVLLRYVYPKREKINLPRHKQMMRNVLLEISAPYEHAREHYPELEPVRNPNMSMNVGSSGPKWNAIFAKGIGRKNKALQ